MKFIRMQSRILPIFYLENLTDEEISEHECSDRIWLNKSAYEHWVTSSDVGVVTVIELKNALEQSVVGTPYNVHHNLEDPDVIYVPNWMFKRLDLDDMVTLSRYEPSLCTGLKLQPHTSDHLTFQDPELTLRNAFERYSCLMPNQEIPLWIGYEFTVTIANLNPTNDKPLCIRDCELELELMPPLDAPIQDSFVKAEAEEAKEAEGKLEAQEIIQKNEVLNEGIVLGGSVSQKSRRELAAEAALRRMKGA